MLQLSSGLRVVALLFTTLHLSSAHPHHSHSHAHKLTKDGVQLPHLSKRATAQAQRYVDYALAGFDQMQTWYSASTGLWSNDWWNSANAITTLADFQEYFPSSVNSITAQVFPATLANAPSYNGYAGFLDGFYDDELWWVLAWIKVFDVTGDTKYLDTASAIFEDAKNAWGTSPCGGLWWDKAHTQVGAVENELYLTAAAKLANRKPDSPSSGYYFNEAIKAYEWFVGSGLINSQNLVNNGLDLSTCKNNGALVFTYNQGIILSGLAELTWATGSETYNDLANTLALAGIDNLTDAKGILHEPCEATGCDGDEEQFKGVFGRNIQFLYNRATNLPAATAATYKNFLQANANAIWTSDQSDNQLGLVWSGASGIAATVQTQSSALDVIVGAACVS